MKKKLFALFFLFTFILILAGCGSVTKANNKTTVTTKHNNTTVTTSQKNNTQRELSALELELKEANPNNEVIYQIFVRSFADSNGDGIGDINGITDKLDYLNDLGVGTLWLMPIFKSSTYHGYNIDDYYIVNPDYGTNDDLKNLCAKAKEKGIRVILDIAFNHSGDNHPWFKSALAGGEYKDYYSVLPDGYKKTGSYWKTRGNLTYYAFFSDQMPDLNLFNPKVVEEIYNISDYWMDLGCSGYRLDAVLYYFYSGEHPDKTYNVTEQNIEFLKGLSEHLKSKYPDVLLLAEAWSSSADYSKYYQAVTPLDFGLSDKLLEAVSLNKLYGYVDTILSLKELYEEYDEDFLWAPFLRNHDQDRLGSLFVSENKLTFAAELLLTLPGAPIIYYGEEIGMQGKKTQGPDIWDETRRLPFVWGDKDCQTTWFVTNDYNSNLPSALTQMKDENSLYNTYKTLIELRKYNIALKYGNNIEKWEKSNARVQGYYRTFTYKGLTQKLLIIHNIDNVLQYIDLIEGNIIYESGLTVLEENMMLDAKSTVIIDVTE